MYEKPLPAIDVESGPFWRAARERIVEFRHSK